MTMILSCQKTEQKIIIFLCIMSFALFFGACYEKKQPQKPPIKIQVQPIDNVYIHYSDDESIFRIGNGSIERTIFLDKKSNHAFTTSFVNKLTKHNYINSLSEEFSLDINQTQVSGITENLQYVKYEIYSIGAIKGLELDFKAKSESFGEIIIRVFYEIYSSNPAIRKWIEIENTSSSAITVSNSLVERLNIMPGIIDDISIHDLAEYLPNKGLVGMSPVILNDNLMEGFIIGNEIPGVMKYYDLYSKPPQIAIGMRKSGDPYALAIQIEPSETWACPAVFIFLFADDPSKSIKTFLDFVSDYITMNQWQNYNAWFEEISDQTTEDLLKDKINQAKNSNFDIFCLKGNWADRRGDWTFENKPYIKNVSEYVHNLDMKFGLCIDFAMAEPDSFILNKYPELVLKPKDKPDYIIPDTNSKLMCLGSKYAVYMAYEISALVKELILDYVRLTGTMIPPPEIGACFADDHIHTNYASSLWSIYDGLFALITYLHSQHKDLIVDVSLEHYYPPGGLDYMLLKYADISTGIKIESLEEE
ncbi:MAG: alpha-galactosidase [Candidatus Poribacteria bacterium]